MDDAIAIYLNYLLLRENTTSLDIKQAVVEFFALELSKRLLIDNFTEGWMHDDEYDVNANDYYVDWGRAFKVEVEGKRGDIESIVLKQQQLCKTVSVPFLNKLKHIHTIDYQLHLLDKSNYGVAQETVKNYLQTSYNTIYRDLIPYFVFMLTTAIYTRHSDQSYLSDPLFLFKNRTYLEPYYNTYMSQHSSDIIVSDLESGHEEQGKSKLIKDIQGIVDRAGNDYTKMLSIAKASITYQKIEHDICDGNFYLGEDSWGQQLENIINATTTLDRSAAITKILTFAHHRAPLIGVDVSSNSTPLSERKDFLFSVLSKQQFDSLNYTNERKAEYDLKKMFS